MRKAVIDANVLVSGLLSPAGNAATILLAVQQKRVRLCFSEDILTEYADVIARPKWAFSTEEVAFTLAMFRDRGELRSCGRSSGRD